MSISVIFPVYNEQGNVKNVVNSALYNLSRMAQDYELILVNDGSNDATGFIIGELSKNYGNLKCLTHKKNLGYGASLRSGFDKANYPLVFFMDCDGQFEFSQLSKLLKEIDSADIVIGKRKMRRDKLYRRIITRVFNCSANLIFRTKFDDISCGFKLIKMPVLKNITLKSQSGIINLEILVKALRLGYSVREVEINHFSRASGKSKGVSISNIIRKIKEMINLGFDLKNLNATHTF